MARKKRVSDYRAAYLRASEAYCEINREVGQHLEALHDAMRRRDAYRPRYEKALRDIDRALFADKTKRKQR